MAGAMDLCLPLHRGLPWSSSGISETVPGISGVWALKASTPTELSCPSPSAGDLRELPGVPLRGEGSCGGGGGEARDPVEVAGPLGTPLGLAQRKIEINKRRGNLSTAGAQTLRKSSLSPVTPIAMFLPTLPGSPRAPKHCLRCVRKCDGQEGGR